MVLAGGDERQFLTQGVLAVLSGFVRIWCDCALRPQVVWGWRAEGEGRLRGPTEPRTSLHCRPERPVRGFGGMRYLVDDSYTSSVITSLPSNAR